MIQLVVGPMGTGKSEIMIEFYEYLEKRDVKATCFKPKADTRSGKIESRNGKSINAIEVENFCQMLQIVKDAHKEGIEYFIIDEIQFLSTEGLIEFVKYVQINELAVAASGLNQTSELTPFETTAHFAMYADSIKIITGKCECCKKTSKVTKCKVEKTDEVLVGDEIYSQTCYSCH